MSVAGPWDGLGMRGNASSPMTLETCPVDPGLQLTDDGAGFGSMLNVVLPIFNLLGNAAGALGLALLSNSVSTRHRSRRAAYGYAALRAEGIPRRDCHVGRISTPLTRHQTPAIVCPALAIDGNRDHDARSRGTGEKWIHVGRSRLRAGPSGRTMPAFNPLFASSSDKAFAVRGTRSCAVRSPGMLRQSHVFPDP
jgi:hypothetical protein